MSVTKERMVGRAVRLCMCLCMITFLVAGCSSAPKYKARGGSGSGKKILKAAKSQVGKRYRFGGRSPKTGFDCSGLAWWSHKVNGLNIPRESADQYYSGRKVSRKRLRPGDLVFFQTYKRGPSHVGIYNGKGEFVHSPNSKKRVQITRLSNSYYKKRYLGARRYW